MSNFLGRSDFNVGQDISVTIKSSNGSLYSAEQLGHLVDVDVDRESDTAKVKAISNGGKVLRMGIPQGVKGRLVFARTCDALEKELMRADQLWFDSKIATYWSFQFVIANRDGTTNSYLAPNCVVGGGKLWGGKADKEVDQDLQFEGPEIKET